MELIRDYIMPPFARIQWASKEIKDKYEPMWYKAMKFFITMEKESVIRGMRRVTTDSIGPKQIMGVQQELLKKGLYFLPLQRVGSYTGVSSYHPPVEEGKPWNFYGVVAREIADAELFRKANAGEGNAGRVDHKVIGDLLGYPECCVEHFEKLFVGERIADLTWHRAIATPPEFIRKREGNLIVLKNIPWQVNNIFKPFSNMAIFHMPCSFSCKKTEEIAVKWFEVANELKVEGLAELEMFLRMPYEWDCFKGIAYIKTPLFKISTNSNFSKERYIVRVEGTYYPDDAPNGIDYPWDTGTKFSTIARNGNKLTYGGN